LSAIMPRQPRTPRTSPLYLWRTAKRWTQGEMAAELGVGRATLQRLEAKPTLPKKYQLAFERIQAKHGKK
jgi:DNA-binding transcriptional regulator YiaG